jgi:hypothetical protein
MRDVAVYEAKDDVPGARPKVREEIVRRKFPTTSQNTQGMVDTRVHEMVKTGILRRAADQPELSWPRRRCLRSPQS